MSLYEISNLINCKKLAQSFESSFNLFLENSNAKALASVTGINEYNPSEQSKAWPKQLHFRGQALILHRDSSSPREDPSLQSLIPSHTLFGCKQ